MEAKRERRKWRISENLAKVERDAKVEDEVAGELRVRVHDRLQVVDGDLVQVAVRYRAHRVQRLAGLTRLVEVRLLDVLAEYVVLACTRRQRISRQWLNYSARGGGLL